MISIYIKNKINWLNCNQNADSFGEIAFCGIAFLRKIVVLF